MEINGRYYDLKFTGYTLLIYKEAFGKDLLSSLSELSSDLSIYFQLLYALVKTADESIGSYETFMKSIDDISEVLNQKNVANLMKVITKDQKATNEVKKNQIVEQKQ